MANTNEAAKNTAFDSFLECISRSFLSSDVETWMQCVRTPLVLVTDTGTLVLKDRMEAIGVFLKYQFCIRAWNVDAIVRVPIEFQVCEDGEILGTYETSLLSRNHRICDPRQSTALLRETDKGLVASSILNVSSPDNFPEFSAIKLAAKRSDLRYAKTLH